jgi:hypothetical protein
MGEDGDRDGVDDVPPGIEYPTSTGTSTTTGYTYDT